MAKTIQCKSKCKAYIISYIAASHHQCSIYTAPGAKLKCFNTSKENTCQSNGELLFLSSFLQLMVDLVLVLISHFQWGVFCSWKGCVWTVTPIFYRKYSSKKDWHELWLNNYTPVLSLSLTRGFFLHCSVGANYVYVLEK